MTGSLPPQNDCGGFFPLFVPAAGRPALVVGGGQIALRRVKTLLRFGVDITVIAPKADEEIQTLAAAGQLRFLCRRAEPADVAPGLLLAVAASSDRGCNRAIGLAAKELGIPVSVADRKEESSFFFPAVIEGGGVIGGIISLSGKDHRLAARQAKRLREILAADHGKEEIYEP